MDAEHASKVAVEAALRVHTELGPGLFESVYEGAMEHELIQRGLEVKRQWPIPVVYDGIKFADGFRADLIVNDCLLIEIKAVEKLAPVHFRQVLTYLRLSGLHLGLLMNFDVPSMKDGLKRVINGRL